MADKIGGEYFDFKPTKDLWVFIDGKLCLEIFALRKIKTHRVELDKIKGLKKGKKYPISIFLRNLNKIQNILMDGTFRFEQVEPPRVDIVARKKIFVPKKEEFIIQTECKYRVHQKWTLEIKNKDNKIIKTISGKDHLPEIISWDGRDESGNYVAEGELFQFILTGVNEAAQEWESNEIIGRSEISIDIGAEITTRNVRYEPFSYELQKDSIPALDRIFMILYNYPKVKILIKGHVASYSKWTRDKSIELSLKRAESVKQYLVESGIEQDRLEVKGFGDTKPKSRARTESAAKLNRRTEFEVISK